MHSNVRMPRPMRTTIELSERTYVQLRARAAERGLRGFSAIVEEALERFFAQDGRDRAALIEAEGSWSDQDVERWERAREEAWETWSPDRSSTQTS